MRKVLFQISALLCLAFSGLSAQEAILADQQSGCDSLTVHFTVVNVPDIGNIDQVVWIFGDGGESMKGTLSTTHTYTTPGIFHVRSYLNGVFDIYQRRIVTIGATPYPDFKYTTNTNGDELEYTFDPQHFNPVPGISLDYYWQFIHSQDTIESFDRSAVYYMEKNDTCFVSLQITDAVGCSGRIDSVRVIGSETLLIPNVFSPNNDDWNDFFTVTTSGEEIWDLKIFSPNGLQIFSSVSPQIIWNGRTMGDNEASEGVYFYVIVRENNSKESYTGFIHLYR